MNQREILLAWRGICISKYWTLLWFGCACYRCGGVPEERQAWNEPGGGGIRTSGCTEVSLRAWGRPTLLPKVVPWHLWVLQVLARRVSHHQDIQFHVDSSWRTLILSMLIWLVLIIIKNFSVFQQENSNESEVTLQNVGFQLSGNFSCEVTTDAPTFSTASSSKTLTVICKFYRLHHLLFARFSFVYFFNAR